jgi:hypothetical protein
MTVERIVTIRKATGQRKKPLDQLWKIRRMMTMETLKYPMVPVPYFAPVEIVDDDEWLRIVEKQKRTLIMVNGMPHHSPNLNRKDRSDVARRLNEAVESYSLK